MEMDDATSEASCEYWSSGDMSEDHEKSVESEEIIKTWLVECLLSRCQFSHFSNAYRSCVTPGSHRTKSSSGNSRLETPESSSRAGQGKKRDRSRDHRGGEDDEQRKRRSLEQAGVSYRGKSKRMACPFFQRDQTKYQNEACVGPGFVDIKSLK